MGRIVLIGGNKLHCRLQSPVCICCLNVCVCARTFVMQHTLALYRRSLVVFLVDELLLLLLLLLPPLLLANVAAKLEL